MSTCSFVDLPDANDSEPSLLSTMFLHRLLSTAQSCTAPSSLRVNRLFSTTLFVQAGYKMKSHSGAKKRWRSLASGVVFKRVST